MVFCCGPFNPPVLYPCPRLFGKTHQKRALDPITDGCEPPCGCWELNSGPLEEQSVLLTAEQSLQSVFRDFLKRPRCLIIFNFSYFDKRRALLHSLG
ncbi:rCG56979 [Rattus norvegicus]|uniref:RCG56979 n=1 Tax=Rattus norvegicus TaxID=10116 RepID=A6JCY4_RAT|nr:rCG56979 [Rattus norvegicus]